MPGILPKLSESDVELGRHPILQHLRESLPQFYHRARQVAQHVGDSLPHSLVVGSDAETPSFWECYQDEFARFSIAPLLINHQIALQALASGDSAQVRVIEKPTGRWWLRGGAIEAVMAAGREAGIPVDTIPGPIVQDLRSLVLPVLASLLSLRGAMRSYSPDGPGVPAVALGHQARDVLFLGVGATSAPIIARLAAYLQSEYGLNSVAADLHFGGSTQALSSIETPIVDAHPLLYGASEIRDALWQWPGWWRHFKAAYPRDEEYGWLRPVVLRRMLIALARDAGWVRARLKAARVILDALRPRVVVGFHRYATVIAPLVLSAQHRGLPTIYCQHGIRGPYYRTLGNLPWDKMLMFGPYSVELFSDLVTPQTEFGVTGHCLYDDVHARAEPDLDEQTRKKFIAGHRYLLVVPTQTDEYLVKSSAWQHRLTPGPSPAGRGAQWWLRGVAEAGHALDAAVVLKVHPEESHADIYQELVQRWPDTVTIVPHGQSNLSRLIEAADLLVTRDSTVAYEANLRGTPVVTVNLSGHKDRFPVAEHGGAVRVCRYEDIQSTLRELLTNDARARLAATRTQFLEYHLGPCDDQATARITSIIAAAAQGQ